MKESITPALRDRVIDATAELELANGKTLAGSLEYFPNGHTLVVLDEDGLEPTQLTVTAADAPVEHAALAADEVLLRNWTETRGVPASLAKQGIVELTGTEVKVGPFRLQAFVARVL